LEKADARSVQSGSVDTVKSNGNMAQFPRLLQTVCRARLTRTRQRLQNTFSDQNWWM